MKSLLRLPSLRAQFCLFALASSLASAETIRLDQLDINQTQQEWGDPHRDRSVEGRPLSIGGQHYEHGLGTHATSSLRLAVNGAQKFGASVGVDGEVANGAGSVEFSVVGDSKELWRSGVMRAGDPPKACQVDLAGVKMLTLKVGDAGDGIDLDHADWADAQFEYSGKAPSTDTETHEEAVVLTPVAPPAPRINGASVVGVRPGHPFFYHVPVSGSRPITLGAAPLPDGLAFDSSRGEVTGTVAAPGRYSVTLTAANADGTTTRQLNIVVGDAIALTPPLGWNSWNCFAGAVDDSKIRAAADAMVSSGLIDHGWTYINIDDTWEGKRDADGMIQSNKKFPDMKALADYVHSKGLKIGLYSSPGPKTCAGFEASWQHENQDAQQYAAWGFDYLKYDWCSYSEVDDKSLPDRQRLIKPYHVMDEALHKLSRDIVFSLCQYGMGNVWEWGADVGGNCWRTTGDIRDSWSSMSGIGFAQNGHEKYAGPGHWNDPDMLVVGKVGWGNLHPTHLKPSEQYTHISLWCLLDAPLLIGCDMSQLDPFTFNLLSNDEVLEVNQDPLGIQAARIAKNGDTEVWAKKMADGSMAVGLFNRGDDSADVTATWESLGFAGKHRVRDLWRQKDSGEFDTAFTATVPRHGVVLVRVW
jgi:alpha-galactosidase